MALILTVDSVFNNPDAPYISEHDPIESRTGSLFLWDAARSPLSAAPVHDTVIPNLLDSFDQATGNNFIFKRATPTSVGTSTVEQTEEYVKRELTAKGGLHFIASQASTVDRSGIHQYRVEANAALHTKMTGKIQTNAANLYVSVWMNGTRYVTKADGMAGVISMLSINTSSGCFSMQQNNTKVEALAGNTVLNGQSKLGLTFKQSEIVNNPNYYQWLSRGYQTSVPTSAQSMRIGAGIIGPWSGTIASNQALNASPCFVLYRIYIEDLDLSGRTYEQVKAIDEAEFAKAFAAGGKFYGDAWNDPSAILP